MRSVIYELELLRKVNVETLQPGSAVRNFVAKIVLLVEVRTVFDVMAVFGIDVVEMVPSSEVFLPMATPRVPKGRKKAHILAISGSDCESLCLKRVRRLLRPHEHLFVFLMRKSCVLDTQPTVPQAVFYLILMRKLQAPAVAGVWCAHLNRHTYYDLLLLLVSVARGAF
jgi:hypothetical protein